MSVNLSTQTGKPKPPDRRDLAALNRALDDAAFVLNLSPACCLLARRLIRRIPKGAPQPISPASVASLARELGVGARAIYDQTRKLEKAGLVKNECLAGGGRTVRRDRTGLIVAIAGISFEPLILASEVWAEKANQLRAEHQEIDRLRDTISKTRRAIRAIITSVTCQRIQTLWTGLPRRIARMSKYELNDLLQIVEDIMSKLQEAVHQSSDRSEENTRPYTTQQYPSESCNEAKISKKAADPDKLVSRPTCGLEHINLRRAMMIAPDDWKVAIQNHGAPSWHALIGVAYERAHQMGVSPSAWAMAQAALGQQGAAIIVMFADAQSTERGGKVRSVGGWVRRMAERAESGTANLHRTMFGLLQAGDAS